MGENIGHVSLRTKYITMLPVKWIHPKSTVVQRSVFLYFHSDSQLNNTQNAFLLFIATVATRKRHIVTLYMHYLLKRFR
jgi:hypothetical protein